MATNPIERLRVQVHTTRYLRYGLLLGAAAGCVNVTLTVLLALLAGSEPFPAGANSLPRLMLADYVGGLAAGLVVGLARGIHTAVAGGGDACRAGRDHV